MPIFGCRVRSLDHRTLDFNMPSCATWSKSGKISLDWVKKGTTVAHLRWIAPKSKLPESYPASLKWAEKMEVWKSWVRVPSRKPSELRTRFFSVVFLVPSFWFQSLNNDSIFCPVYFTRRRFSVVKTRCQRTSEKKSWTNKKRSYDFTQIFSFSFSLVIAPRASLEWMLSRTTALPCTS